MFWHNKHIIAKKRGRLATIMLGASVISGTKILYSTAYNDGSASKKVGPGCDDRLTTFPTWPRNKRPLSPTWPRTPPRT